jgi:hypothetical protein
MAMCKKQDCPSFLACYRAQAVPNPYRQAYIDFDNGSESHCAEFIATREARKRALDELAAESQRLGLYDTGETE